MANPDNYVPQYGFTNWQPNETPLPGTALDNEFDNISTALGGTITALEDIRRSDGALKNGIVTVESLGPDVNESLGISAAAEAMAARDVAVAARDAALASSTLSQSWAEQPFGTDVIGNVSKRSSLHYSEISHSWATQAAVIADMLGVMIYDFGLLTDPTSGVEDWGTL